MTRTERALDRLLDDEHAALLKGDVAQLNRIATRKEKLIDKLEPTQKLEGLRAKSKRNQSLIDASMKGILAVRDRIAFLRKGAPGGTYSALGQKENITTPLRKMEKRA